MTTRIMPVTDLRRQTSDVIRSIQQNGDTVYITQHGRPTVVLVDYERFEAMRAQQEATNYSTKQREAAKLLQSWIADSDEEEQIATGDALITGLDENRPSDRPLFPQELEGETW